MVRLVLPTICVFMLGIPVLALGQNPSADFLISHYTTDNGLPVAAAIVNATEQTQDGFLWIAADFRLVRYDGKNFHLFDKLPLVTTLAVAPDGALWIGTREGVARIPPASFSQFSLGELTFHRPGPGKASEIEVLHFSKNGVLWVGTAEGLFRYEGDRFVAVGPRAITSRIEEAPNGHMVLVTSEGFTEFTNSEVVPHPELPDQLGVKANEIFHILNDRQGNIWYCTKLGVARYRSGRIEKLGTYARPGHAAYRAFEDAQGTVWIGKDEGLFRATPAGLELVVAGMQVRSLYNDRDGNLWIGTNGDGLYRFTHRAVRMFTTANGLPNDVLMTVIVAHDGAVWAGANCGGIVRFDGTHFQTYNEKNGLSNSCVWALAEDANRDLWIGTWGGGAFRYHNGVFTQYSKGQGLVSDRVLSIFAGQDGSVWFGTPGGISRLRNGQFRTYTTADGLSHNNTFKVFEDRAGVIWCGTRGGLDRLVGDRFENVAAVPKSPVIPLGNDRDGGFFVYVDAESVNLRLDNDRAERFTASGTADMIETEQGHLWLDGNPVRRLPPRAFANARTRDEPLDYEAFSTADGLATASISGSGRTLALTRDNKLWAATSKGLAVFDLNRLPITNTKPSIYLTDVTIGRDKHRAGREVVLPPGTSHFEIHFAPVEISAPEKIRLQYRLDGVDSEWLDAPANPNAIYSKIPVGTHALHIRACNRNGIWDREGMVFMVTQQPYFYQTRWFVAAMCTLGVLLVVLVYRLRVAQISRRMTARFDERLAERTRVARELHDTFLQTVQGSKLVADHALKNSADHGRMVRSMEQLSQWLAQATEEGRAALHSLRASTTERNDLAEAFRRAIDECGKASSVETSFSVDGASREMHPVVRDEIYRIGYEAIRNSCAHSRGDRLEVTLKYAHDLTLCITDNGVGIDSEVVEQGKDGHFGLRGMRERAERIGSKFTLVSSPDSGTVITLVVPGRTAFRSEGSSWSERMKSLINSN